MNRPNLENYDELCRLCASYDAIKMDIFSDRGKERKLLDKITTCLPFQVSEDDLLPKSLCYRCIYNLENFYDFRRGCIDALARLEKVIQQSLLEDPQRCTEVPNEKENGLPIDSEMVVESLEQNSLIHHRGIEDEFEEDGLMDCSSDQDQPNPADFLEACLGEAPMSMMGRKHNCEEEEGLFRCEVCSRLFNSRSSLTIHAKFHRERSNGEDKEMFSCYVCEKIFSSKGHLALHSRVHIGEAHSVCQSTSRASPANIKLYRCDLCNKTYSMAKHLWGHVSTSHRGDPLVTCNICLRTFSSISNLDDHKRIKHKNNNMDQIENLTPEVELAECSNGRMMEEKKSTMEESSGNKRKSSKPRKIERESEVSMECVYERDQEIRHTSHHPGGYVCMFCGEKYEDQATLSAHLLTFHGSDGPMDSEYAQDSYIESEFAESMVEAETVFCCEICIREFSDKASLWLHMLYSHRDEASKACGICLKICPDNESLIQHVEVSHPRDKTDQRRYSCQVCARQHDSRKKLVTHAKIHKLTDADGNLIDPETVVVLNSEFYGNDPSSLQNSMGDGSFMLQCEICYNFFESESKLVKHKRSAHRDTVGPNSSSGSNTYHYYFACEICGLSHTTRTDRWKHMSTTHSGDLLVTCEVPECGKVFPTSSVKREHAEHHHRLQGQFPNTCEVCGKMWKTRVEYWKHMMGVHADCLPYICGVCLKVFCNLSDLVSHVRSLHWPLTGGDFCCDICGRPYSKASKMTRHRKIHNVPDMPSELRALLDNPKLESEPHFLQQTSSFFCDMCDGVVQEYESLEDLNKHRRTVHNVMSCDLCMKYYGRTSHLWKHVNKIHKGHPEITCNICQRTSASRLHLANHMAKHHRNETSLGNLDSSLKENGASHNCEKCSKVFRKESLMKKHMKHCKGPRQSLLPLPNNGVYTCEKCSKTFTVQNTLYKHMKNSHIDYNCEFCETIVDSKTALFNHVRDSHPNHPDVRCDYKGCDKLLRCKADLDRHIRDHRQNLQLHVCKFCAELVSSKLKMRKHLKTAHAKDTKHLCALCLKALPSYKDLMVHVEESHAVALSRPNTCPVCAKPCGNKSKLLEHIKYHGSNFHPCKICFKIFSSKEELNDHITNHPSDSGDEEDQIEEVELDPNSIMDIIGAPKTDLVELNRGEDSDDQKNKTEESFEEVPHKKMKYSYECQGCGKGYPSEPELEEHKDECIKVYKCDKCGKVSSNILEHRNHIMLCIDSSSELSDIKNSILETVLSDMKKESEEKDSSDKETKTSSPPVVEVEKVVGRGKNNRKVYNDDFTPTMCELCGKVWPAKRHLWQHLIRFHKAEAGTSCGICLKLCMDYKSLSAHLIIEHPYNFEGDGTNLSCRVCGKYHNARSKLQNHVAIHVGQEERALSSLHQCLLCNTTFASFSVLCDHNIKVHNLTAQESQKMKHGSESGMAPKLPEDLRSIDSIKMKLNSSLPFFSCDVCSLVFASEIGLTNHRRLHERSENFKCGQCGEVFVNAETLGSHKAAKHKGAEFVCADCKSNFASYSQLIEHNKQCMMKLKNSEREMSCEEDEEPTSGDVEECEDDSVVLNGTQNEDSSSESYADRTEDNPEEEDDIESDLSDNEEQKSSEDEISERLEEMNSGEEFEELVEVVEVDIDACSSPKSDQ